METKVGLSTPSLCPNLKVARLFYVLVQKVAAAAAADLITAFQIQCIIRGLNLPINQHIHVRDLRHFLSTR